MYEQKTFNMLYSVLIFKLFLETPTSIHIYCIHIQIVYIKSRYRNFTIKIDIKTCTC